MQTSVWPVLAMLPNLALVFAFQQLQLQFQRKEDTNLQFSTPIKVQLYICSIEPRASCFLILCIRTHLQLEEKKPAAKKITCKLLHVVMPIPGRWLMTHCCAMALHLWNALIGRLGPVLH